MGGPGSGSRPNPERRRRIVELRAAGLSLVQIARRLGVTHQLVHYHLKAAGDAAPRRGLVRCHTCGGRLTAGHHLIERNRAPLCLACLAARPDAPFGLRLKAHRLASGLTQAELARRTGVAETSIGRYERGEVVPGPATVAVLVRLLGQGLIAGESLGQGTP